MRSETLAVMTFHIYYLVSKACHTTTFPLNQSNFRVSKHVQNDLQNLNSWNDWKHHLNVITATQSQIICAWIVHICPLQTLTVQATHAKFSGYTHHCIWHVVKQTPSCGLNRSHTLLLKSDKCTGIYHLMYHLICTPVWCQLA